MSELVQQHLSEAKDAMQKAVSHTEAELAKIRAGKAMPSMLDGIQVDYYGSMMPLNQVSNVNTPDTRTIMVQPWEKSMLQPIEKAIMDANLGFNPQRSAEHTSELQSLMRTSYAVFCLNKKTVH